MEELTYFSQEDVRVTSTRFVTGRQTFVMSNITSVKTLEVRHDKFGVFAILIVPLVIALFFPVVGLILTAAAGYWAYAVYTMKPTYYLVIATAAGEVSALQTKDKIYFDKIVAALNEAIVKRG